MLFLHLLAVILKDLRTIRAIHLPQMLHPQSAWRRHGQKMGFWHLLTIAMFQADLPRSTADVGLLLEKPKEPPHQRQFP